MPWTVLTVAPRYQHMKGEGENNSQHLVVTPNNTFVTQLNVMQEQFSIFQLVLAQLLAKDNLGDPLINLLNPAH